ncbi:ATP-binding protein [Blastococcus sp. BMG 814]|uniref:ATP-binding protein n=1 Tax=Blastococcus carthaginiensis TaxID=3050034 RepID=A0ABT9IAN8_9ACTN|nr:ATP-binding protein [Blastococcus carthaginiensis]MDP5182629.1 ATP-binding protein [Blastococcus carthaginiensis]
MTQQFWAYRPPPAPDAGMPSLYHGEPATAAEISAGRAQLRTAVVGSAAVSGPCDDDLDRLLLVFEELVSNGLRHGSPPVQVTVTGTAGGWLLQVSDAAADRPPSPPIGRDPSAGGMGLNLVAALCPAHGWGVHAGRKVVWGCLEPVPPLGTHRP